MPFPPTFRPPPDPSALPPFPPGCLFLLRRPIPPYWAVSGLPALPWNRDCNRSARRAPGPPTPPTTFQRDFLPHLSPPSSNSIPCIRAGGRIIHETLDVRSALNDLRPVNAGDGKLPAKPIA